MTNVSAGSARFSVSIITDAMHPRFKLGQFARICPETACDVGDEVMVVTTDGRVLIGELGESNDDLVRLKFLNAPDAIVEAESVSYVAGWSREPIPLFAGYGMTAS